MNFEQMAKNIIIEKFKSMCMFTTCHKVAFYSGSGTSQKFTISYIKNNKNFSMLGSINISGFVRFRVDSEKEI